MAGDLLRAALDYTARGLPVHPLHDVFAGFCSCGDANCDKGGKHPRLRAWQKRATMDDAKIRDWWKEYPAANIGIATGAASGLFVLDVDPPSGADSLAALERKHGTLPVTVTARTGRGGLHYLFRHPGGHVPGKPGIVGPNLDVRCDGNYIVAPPSVSKHGRYTWQPGRSPGDVPLADAPEWLVALARGDVPSTQAKQSQDATRAPESTGPRAISSTSGTPALDALRSVPEGRRHVTLNGAAFSDRIRGADDDAIQRGLFAAASRCVPANPTRDTAGILRSIRQIPPGKPVSAEDARWIVLRRLGTFERSLFVELYARREYGDRPADPKLRRPARAENQTWISDATLAKSLDVSSKTVQRGREHLRDAGLITWTVGCGTGPVFSFPHPYSVQPQTVASPSSDAVSDALPPVHVSNLSEAARPAAPSLSNLSASDCACRFEALGPTITGGVSDIPVLVLDTTRPLDPDPQGSVCSRTPPNPTARSTVATSTPNARRSSRSSSNSTARYADDSTLEARKAEGIRLIAECVRKHATAEREPG